MEPKEGDTKRRKTAETRVDDGTEATCLLDLTDHVIVENILALLFPLSLFGCNEPTDRDLRDILSAASTCTRIRALASHPSLWRRINAAVFCRRFRVAIEERGVANTWLPLGAAHCGVFSSQSFVLKSPDVALLESLRGLTRVVTNSIDLSADDFCRFARSIASQQSLSRLEIHGSGGAFCLAGVALPHSLKSLRFGGDCAGDIGRFFRRDPLPSLTDLTIFVSYGRDPFCGAIARSCPNLRRVAIHGAQIDAESAAAMATKLSSLEKLEFSAKRSADAVVIGREVQKSKRVPHLRDLSVVCEGRLGDGFLSMFCGLEKLCLVGDLELTGCLLEAIGGMVHLESLSLDGANAVGDSCRRLLGLVNHSMANGRRSLRSLQLSRFGDDLSEFLLSSWCSQLEVLSLDDCDAQSVLGSKLTSEIHCSSSFSRTLQKLSIGNTSRLGKGADGQFIARLSSLKDLTLMQCVGEFDVDGFLHECGKGSAELSQFTIMASQHGVVWDVTPVLRMLRNATNITLWGEVDQVAADSIAESCSSLRRFSIETVFPVVAPHSLSKNCTFTVSCDEL